MCIKGNGNETNFSLHEVKKRKVNIPSCHGVTFLTYYCEIIRTPPLSDLYEQVGFPKVKTHAFNAPNVCFLFYRALTGLKYISPEVTVL
jgi:hypothetical protein